jgi:hypothetical protein
MSDTEGSAATPATASPGAQPDPFAALRRALVEENPARPRLSYRSAMILRLRFGLHDDVPRTLEEVGNLFGVTRECVRQAAVKALALLGLDRLRSAASSHRVSDPTPEPGYRLIYRVADLPDDTQGAGLRAWFRGAWRPARVRRRYQRVCEMVVDMGDGEPVETRLPVTRIAVPEVRRG